MPVRVNLLREALTLLPEEGPCVLREVTRVDKGSCPGKKNDPAERGSGEWEKYGRKEGKNEEHGKEGKEGDGD